ncbi:TOM1-like protein 2 isoform X2 [Venturia canescens]|uniref:TOM1-like protein 2 isoform X2 n=1 Tax=Venturia canescens TaxID=32260 RepID=UPI001C9C9F55|nr:TOM1-like protein 2 isoform X2 [Venturia canescens]
MSFFGVNVNPFSTPVGQRIEQATDGSLPSENWALNMEICDIVNETEDGPRDAIKAIKRRLNQAASKNYTVVMYTLIVLETCVKNCGKRFHTLACSRDFVQDLVKTIGPKNEPPTVVQEKVLSLIRTWADTFRHQPHAQGVCQVYQELKAKGIQFPITDLDTMAPIITPERSVPETEQTSAANMGLGSGLAQGQTPVVQAGATMPTHPSQGKEDAIGEEANHQQQQPTLHHGNPSAGGALNIGVSGQPLHEELIAKLRSELDVVQGNMTVLSEMLAYLTSPEQTAGNRQPEAADLELLQQLYATCKSMQERVVELIGRLVDDEMTAELLRINDELNNLFLRYSRYTKNKVGGQQPAAASAILARTIGQQPSAVGNPLSGPHSTPSKRTGEPDSLIDLSDGVDSLNTQISDLGISGDGPMAARGGAAAPGHHKDKEHDSDEFDMFAQSRNATYETTKNSGSKYEDNMESVSEGVGLSTAILNRANPKPSPQHQQHNAATGIPPSSTSNPGDRGDTESLTSSEFERFLAERAAAAEALPTLPVVTAAPAQSSTSSPAPGSTGTNIQRQINKDQDKSLFAL